MRLTELRIRNYKSISDLLITDIENALILVGKNNTGKTAILDAIRVVTGSCAVEMDDFQEDYANIEISVCLLLSDNDLKMLHAAGQISTYRRFDKWFQDFKRKLPSYDEAAQALSFTFIATATGKSVTATDIRRITTGFPDCCRRSIIWTRSAICGNFRTICCSCRKTAF